MSKKPSKLWKVVAALLVVAAVIMGCQAWDESMKEVDATQTAMADEYYAPFATQTAQALTPSPTPTFVHHITDLVTHHKPDNGLNGTITGAACDQNGMCHVDDTLNDYAEDGVSVRVDCYDILYALYDTAYSGLNPQKVQVNVFGNETDKYGNKHKVQIAIAELTKQTESLFNWKGLNYDSAWDVYDLAESDF
jgi:hypothetical protein